MKTSTRTSHLSRTTTKSLLLALVGVVMALLAAGPAPSASAYWASATGSYGSVTVDPGYDGRSELGFGYDKLVDGKTVRMVASNGVRAKRYLYNDNAQTLTTTVTLWRWTGSDFTPVDSITRQDGFPTITPDNLAYRPLTMRVGNSTFKIYDTPGTSTPGSLYGVPMRSYFRVTFGLTWTDQVTGKVLGTVAITPEGSNYTCKTSWLACTTQLNGSASIRF